MQLLILFFSVLPLTLSITSDLEIYSYDIHLSFSESSFSPPYSYDGYVALRFKARNHYPPDVTLHASEDFINVSAVSLELPKNNATKKEWEMTDGYLTLKNTSVIHDHLYYSHLFINYTSRLNTESMHGLYLTSFKEGQTTRYMISSHFEPNFACRVFPGLDNLTYKSKFRLNVTAPSNREVFFNTPQENLTNTNGYRKTQFQVTGPMSTYMMGIMVINPEDFTCTIGENFTFGTIEHFKVCSRRSMAEYQQYALDIGPTIMDALYNFTKYTYGVMMGFEKLDLIAHPKHETQSWGIVNFVEENLLYDEAISTILDKQRVVQMLTYELSQFWFGNLATPETWNYTYVSKGMAYYLKFIIPGNIYSDWDLDKQLYQVLQTALELDSYKSSKSLYNGGNTTEEVINMNGPHDVIKGASLIKMVNDTIAGYTSFRQGVEYFLTSFRSRTYTPEDLWNLVSTQINLDNRDRLPEKMVLKDVISSWEKNPGFPLIQVHINSSGIYLQQRGRFLYSDLDTSLQWVIPVTYTLSSNLTDFDNTTVDQYMFPNETLALVLPSHNEDWIIINTQASGFYRVHYDDMWRNISKALSRNISIIPDLNRAQLIDDLFALARANIVSYPFVFEYLDYLANEESVTPWISVFNGLDYIFKRVSLTSNLSKKIQSRFRALFSRIEKSVSWNTNANDTYSIKQIETLRQACRLGSQACISNATNLFQTFKNGGKPPKNLRSIVYCYGLKYQVDGWQRLWKVFEESNFSAEKVHILDALGCADNADLSKITLSIILEKSSELRPKDVSTIFTSVYSNSEIGANFALQFFLENHEHICERYKLTNIPGEIVVGLAKNLRAPLEISRLQTFLNSSTLSREIQLVMDEALEIMNLNLLWQDRHLMELYEYFDVVEEPEEANGVEMKRTIGVGFLFCVLLILEFV